MSQLGQTEKSDRPPGRSVLPPEPDIDAKQPDVARGARSDAPLSQLTRPGRGHVTRAYWGLPHSGGPFYFQPELQKSLSNRDLPHFAGREKSAGLQVHTTLPYASTPVVCTSWDRPRSLSRPAIHRAHDAIASTA